MISAEGASAKPTSEQSANQCLLSPFFIAEDAISWHSRKKHKMLVWEGA